MRNKKGGKIRESEKQVSREAGKAEKQRSREAKKKQKSKKQVPKMVNSAIFASRLWQMLPLGCVLAAGSFTTWKPWENWGKSKGAKKSWETIIGSNFLEHEHPHSLSWFYSHRNLLKSSLSLSHGITRLVQKGDSPNRRIRSGAGYTPLHVQIHQCHTISYHIIIA